MFSCEKIKYGAVDVRVREELGTKKRKVILINAVRPDGLKPANDVKETKCNDNEANRVISNDKIPVHGLF